MNHGRIHWDNRDDLGDKFAEATKGVTNIKKWQNSTELDVEVSKFEPGREDNYKVLPGQVVSGDMCVVSGASATSPQTRVLVLRSELLKVGSDGDVSADGRRDSQKYCLSLGDGLASSGSPLRPKSSGPKAKFPKAERNVVSAAISCRTKRFRATFS